ncbi:MAG: BTB And C-terminal Kelch, variant 2 [Marteilia pararefringens]
MSQFTALGETVDKVKDTPDDIIPKWLPIQSDEFLQSLDDSLNNCVMDYCGSAGLLVICLNPMKDEQKEEALQLIKRMNFSILKIVEISDDLNIGDSKNCLSLLKSHSNFEDYKESVINLTTGNVEITRGMRCLVVINCEFELLNYLVKFILDKEDDRFFHYCSRNFEFFIAKIELLKALNLNDLQLRLEMSLSNGALIPEKQDIVLKYLDKYKLDGVLERYIAKICNEIILKIPNRIDLLLRFKINYFMKIFTNVSTQFANEEILFDLACMWSKYFHNSNQCHPNDKDKLNIAPNCRSIFSAIDINKIKINKVISALEQIGCQKLKDFSYDVMKNYILSGELCNSIPRLYNKDIIIRDTKSSSDSLTLLDSLHCTQFIINGKNIYTFGNMKRLTDGNLMEIPPSSTFKSISSRNATPMTQNLQGMIKARAMHCTCRVFSEIFVFGGRNDDGKIESTIEKYSIEDNSIKEWQIVSTMQQPLMSMACISLDTEIFLIGGCTFDLSGSSKDFQLHNKVQSFCTITRK